MDKSRKYKHSFIIESNPLWNVLPSENYLTLPAALSSCLTTKAKYYLTIKKIKPDFIRFFVSLIQQINCLIAISEVISSAMPKVETTKDIHLQL